MTADKAESLQILWHTLEERPYSFDLFALLRKLQAFHASMPRLGRALRPIQEPLRVGQEASLSFAPSTIARMQRKRGDGEHTPKAIIYSFGLFGPNGPLPMVLTEHARERVIHYGDHTLVEFLDIFHHRLTLLFFRAWADTQSTVNLDRPGDDAFTRYASSILNFGIPTLRNRDSVPDHARLNHAGHLVRQTRNAEGLERILGNFFSMPVRVEEFMGHWLPIPVEQRTRLGTPSGSVLGIDAIVGQCVWDRQYRFRLHLGPMTRKAYDHLLPIGKGWRQLLDWVRTYIGIEFIWDVRLVLRADEVPSTTLDKTTRLGWATWLGSNPSGKDRGDLILDSENHPTLAKMPVS
jgi:type VI secretion system protein ImpH